jgi:SagB-type dehydrogenase family enzyme
MSYTRNREYLKAHQWEEWDDLATDQKAQVQHPQAQKPIPENAPIIDLVPPDEFSIGNLSVRDAIARRRSRRDYSSKPISLEGLSYLLWATQGVTDLRRDGRSLLRTVPSAGARHPFETYLLVNNVTSLDNGLYRYMSVEHKLGFLNNEPESVENFYNATYEQYVDRSAVVFIWTVIPYRTEWRYGPLSHKMIAIDSGHVCQNLYLACESLGIGTCAIGAYDQKLMDKLLRVDGEDEFTIYVATVGQVV